jgi:serine O-acetyltransferase
VTKVRWRRRDENWVMEAVRQQHPRFFHAVLSDAERTVNGRFEQWTCTTRWQGLVQALRLMWVTDAFFAQTCYRAKARLQALGVPVLPRIFHRLAMSSAQVCIGDPVVLHPGVYIVHGQVVLDGLVEVQPGTAIFPWVTIGLNPGHGMGAPKVGRDVRIYTGAKVVGPITVGDGARIGANAVVMHDVPARATVAGSPARPVGRSAQAAG